MIGGKTVGEMIGRNREGEMKGWIDKRMERDGRVGGERDRENESIITPNRSLINGGEHYSHDDTGSEGRKENIQYMCV